MANIKNRLSPKVYAPNEKALTAAVKKVLTENITSSAYQAELLSKLADPQSEERKSVSTSFGAIVAKVPDELYINALTKALMASNYELAMHTVERQPRSSDFMLNLPTHVKNSMPDIFWAADIADPLQRGINNMVQKMCSDSPGERPDFPTVIQFFTNVDAQYELRKAGKLGPLQVTGEFEKVLLAEDEQQLKATYKLGQLKKPPGKPARLVFPNDQVMRKFTGAAKRLGFAEGQGALASEDFSTVPKVKNTLEISDRLSTRSATQALEQPGSM